MRNLLLILDRKPPQLKLIGGGSRFRLFQLGRGLVGIVHHADPAQGGQERAHDLELTVRRNIQQDPGHILSVEVMFQGVENHRVQHRDIHDLQLGRQCRFKADGDDERRIRSADFSGELLSPFEIAT